MGSAEWLGAASLAVALAALAVAGIAAANQLASLKRPLPTVDLLAIMHVDDGPSAPAGSTDQMFISGLIIRITNRGHEPMLHPMVYDWTEGSVLTSLSKRKNHVPSVLGPGQSVELVTNYSLANNNDRVIGVTWEEASLFRREPATMGAQYRLSRYLPGMWNAPPTGRWKRIGLSTVKGWQKTGSDGTQRQPTTARQKLLDEGASWGSTQDQAGLDIYAELRIVTSAEGGLGERVQGLPNLTLEEIKRMRKRGEGLSA